MAKVAIVDTEPDLQRLYKLALASRGHDILYIASDGVEAVEKNRNTPAQIIIMGNYMPTKNGLEATREILAERPRTKIIMTAASETIEQEAYKAGAVRFLKKPLSLKELVSTIDEVARSSSHRLKTGIIEDDLDRASLIKICLQRQGYHIAYVEGTGRAGLKKNRKNPAQIVILNHLLPDMSGLDIMNKMLDEFPNTKIIYETGSKVYEMAMSAGATRYIHAPFKLGEFVKIVNEVALETLYGPGSREDRVLSAKVRGPREDRVLRSIRRLEQMDNHPNG